MTLEPLCDPRQRRRREGGNHCLLKAWGRPFPRVSFTPHLSPSPVMGILLLWMGPFGCRFHPVLPADFTECHQCKGPSPALKKFLIWSESRESGGGPSQQGVGAGGGTGERGLLTSGVVSQLCLQLSQEYQAWVLKCMQKLV